MSKLQESERASYIKYKLIVENSSDLVMILNEDLTIDYTNKTAHLVLLNYSEEDLFGRNIEDFIQLKDFLKVSGHFKDVFDSGEESFEVRMLHKNGHYIWFESKLRAFLDENDVKKAVMISREITEHKNVEKFISEISERRRTENLMKKEIQRIKEFDKIRNDLISGISHELKTPLMSINGACELILEVYKEQLGEDAFELIKMMSRGAERLGILIEKLLDISRIQFEKLELERKDENLSEIIKGCVKEVNYFLKGRNLELTQDLPSIMNISVDKIRIEQVITNLLLNAIKNTPPKGNIKISLQKKDNLAQIIVRDSGIGLTKDEMEKLFTKFGKIERSGAGFEYLDIQGSGLGLFITKEIVEMHCGEISAQSSGRNKGATFIVTLPFDSNNNKEKL
ncbi:MAG: ATP-binding protein [Promethearchaeota archaeon]